MIYYIRYINRWKEFWKVNVWMKIFSPRRIIRRRGQREESGCWANKVISVRSGIWRESWTESGKMTKSAIFPKCRLASINAKTLKGSSKERRSVHFAQHFRRFQGEFIQSSSIHSNERILAGNDSNIQLILDSN